MLGKIENDRQNVFFKRLVAIGKAQFETDGKLKLKKRFLGQYKISNVKERKCEGNIGSGESMLIQHFDASTLFQVHEEPVYECVKKN